MEEPENTASQSLVSFNTTAPEQSHVQAVQQAMDDPAAIVAPMPQQENAIPDAYKAIIDQQQAQIKALIAQTNAQSAQITQLVQNGGQLTAQQMQPQQFAQAVPQPKQVQFPNVYQPYDAQAAPNANWQPPSMLDDGDYSLESLGKEIGKHERV